MACHEDCLRNAYKNTATLHTVCMEVAVGNESDGVAVVVVATLAWAHIYSAI